MLIHFSHSSDEPLTDTSIFIFDTAELISLPQYSKHKMVPGKAQMNTHNFGKAVRQNHNSPVFVIDCS